jgi:hypothetical protein
MDYFEMTMHVGIAFKVDSSFKLAIPTLMQYLIIGNLGLCCNNYIHTYL